MANVGSGLPTCCVPRAFHSVLAREGYTSASGHLGRPSSLHLIFTSHLRVWYTRALSSLVPHQLPALFSTIFLHQLHFLRMHGLWMVSPHCDPQDQGAEQRFPKRQQSPKVCASWLFGEQAEAWTLVNPAAQEGFFFVFPGG